MIIVSQDKETIVNFNNITRISVVPLAEEELKYALLVNGGLDLGHYKTKERAKEVLQEISFVYKCSESRSATIGEISSLSGNYEYGVYEMPEE